MSELQAFDEYERTRAKLAKLEQRLSDLEKRTDISAKRLNETRHSYHVMMQQYLKEAKLFEATHGLAHSSH